MPYLFGDSFGQLGQEALSDEANRRIAMANSVNAASQGLQSGIRSKLAARAQDLAEAQAEFEAGPEGHPELGYKGKQLALQTSEAQAKAQAEIDRNAIAQQWVKIGQQQVDQQKLANPTLAKQQDLDYNRALLNGQMHGAWESPEEIRATFPSLTEGQASAIFMVNQNTRRQHDQEYDLAQNAASVLSRRDALKKQLSDLGSKPGDEPPSTTGWHPFTSDVAKAKNQQVAQALTEWKQISPKASKIESDKRFSSLVTYDPSSDSYAPAMPMPPWRANMAQSLSRSGATLQPQGNPTGLHGAGVPAPAPAPSTGTSGPRYNPWIYQRVNELIGTGSVDAAAAKRQAVMEYNSAAAAGNLP